MGEIAADAVTSDLRTQDNALSFWRCGGANSDVEDAALAIAAGRNEIAKVELVWLDDEVLHADGQTLVETAGRTPVTELVDLHVDLCRLDYERLGKVARCIVTAFAEERYLRMTRVRVRNLLASAVRGGRVDLDELKKKVRDEVQVSLGTSK